MMTIALEVIPLVPQN